MDTFAALKDAESCAYIIAQTVAPKHIQQSGEVHLAFAGNHAQFWELNYLQKAKSLVFKVCSGDVEFMQWQHHILCWSLEVASLDTRIRSSDNLLPIPLENTPHFYFTQAAHYLFLSWSVQAKNVIAVRQLRQAAPRQCVSPMTKPGKITCRIFERRGKTRMAFWINALFKKRLLNASRVNQCVGFRGRLVWECSLK